MIGKRFIELLSVDSTNNYAMQRVQNGTATHGDAYFAFEQTAGKGQFSKQWVSAPGENIILSVVIDARQFEVNQQFVLNMISALSVAQIFNKYSTEKIRIKWPNDIYCRDRKAAGILIENLIRGKKWQFAIAGFGINVNQTAFPGNLRNPVSLKQLTGIDHDVVGLAKELCNLLEKNLAALPARQDMVLGNYNKLLYKRDQVATFKHDGKIFSGLVKKVDDTGNIIIDNGVEKAYQTGQIEWLH